MLILDLLLDIIIGVYTSLGIGTKEYKINLKVEKISKAHPCLMNYYKKFQKEFEGETHLSRDLLALNLKKEVEVEQFLKVVKEKFD
ncbi:hypothetical protein GLW07_19160 [Bacillus hwajinpoensis]|uniref:Uncharacterized protein n=1 Tax=Guptibacillus hwajinpoensis TaxID=208199 RepID=A0A845F354_9BACL|nr:hypothetical protein [Pseudalkalibacillus hwajinpoensis]MYL65482.1 hypothetical protein [Pseudalkalibacillus hwajinpoensis]